MAVQDAQVVPGARLRVVGVQFVAGAVDDLERGVELALLDIEGGHSGGQMGRAGLLLGGVGLLQVLVKLLAFISCFGR